jgi:hypothetical protein
LLGVLQRNHGDDGAAAVDVAAPLTVMGTAMKVRRERVEKVRVAATVS